MHREILFLFLILTLSYNCYGNICGEYDCVNGQCENNLCVCQECYTGPTCELIKNKSPHFEKSSYVVEINKKSIDDNKFLKVTAYDDDKCLTVSCGCAEIIYSILEENVKEKFEINSNTGEISATPGQIEPRTKYSFTVKASNKNPFDNTYDTATVFINADASDEILERHRRAVSPTKPAFSLSQIFPVQNLTSINIGQRLTMQLIVTFPVGTTTLSVELFAPETSSNPVMMLCDVTIASVGSQLTPNTFTPSVVEGINGTVWPHTHVVYNFSNVVNNQASPNNLSDIQVTINFDVVMLYSPSTVNGTTYYVSGGSEYLNGTEIWVGQLGYVVNLATPTPNPNITITGDTQIYPGRTASFSVNIQAPDAYLYLNLAVYTPLNNTAALSLCIVRRNYVGIAYGCLPTNYNQPTLTSMTINNQIYYTTAAMNLGILGNRYYMEPSHVDINEKTINIAVSARINPSIWIGNSYYIGFSINYTASMIYTSTYPVQATTAPALIPYTSSISYDIAYYLGVQQMNIGQPGRLLLNITIPSGTELDYTITARSKDNKSEICGVMVLRGGMNIPCIDQINLNTQYTLTADNYAIQAVTTINAIRHVKISNDINDDILMLLVIYRPINDTRNNPGDTIDIGVALNWTGAAGSEKSKPITLNAFATSNANSTNLPKFTFQMKGNDGNISVGSTYQLFFSMRLSPGAIYAPTSLEFYMPFNNTIRVSMCEININFVGKNVLCFNPTLMTKKFIYSSKINNTLNYDKLLIPIGVLCTSSDPSLAASINDEIQITIDVLILSHSMNTVGATSNLNGGMMITSTQIWVGNQPLTFVTKPAAPTLNAANSPLIFGQRIDALNNIVWANDMAIIQYIIKVAPAVLTSTMTLSISSSINTNNNFGVCQITIKSRGSSIPCVNGTFATSPWEAFSKYYRSATFTFTDILNSGTTTLTSNPAFDENSILVEAIVKFGPTLPASFTVDASVTSNGVLASKSLTFTYQSALSRFNGTLSTTEPVFSMVLSPLFNNTLPVINNIAYSEAIRSVVNVKIQPGVLQSLKIIFASAPSSMNQMDVLSVNILSVGVNIPCLQTGMIPFSVQKRSNSFTSDLTSVDMGTICHRQSAGNTTIEDNKIYLEAVFRVWKLPKDLPTNLQINVIGLLNNDQVYVTRIVFNTSSTTYVSDTNLLGQTPNATASVSSSTVAIGAIFTVNVTVNIPPYTQCKSGTIQILSPIPPGSDSSYFISGNLSYIGIFGKNIGINSNEPLPMTLKSSMNTSQMDNMIVDFGVVQNIGTPYRLGQANYSSPTVDDMLSVKISVQLTDNMVAYNGQIINFNVTTSFGAAIQNIPLQITVSRTNTETINFNTTTTILTNNTIYTSDTPITVSTQAIMLNTSTLECRNFTVYIAVPSFIRLSSVFNSSYSSTGFQIVSTNLALGGFSFSVPYFFYKENISILFQMSVIPGLNLTKGRTQSSLTVPVIYACQTLNWSSNPMGNKYFNKVDPLVFTVKGSDLNVTVSSCNDDLKLTDNTVIKDCAINAYMSPYPGFEAIKIRSNSGSYWKPHIRSGQYNKLRYIDIKFGKLTTVSKIVVTSTIANKPQKLTVYGTMDGRAYTMYQDLSLSYGSGSTASVVLNNPPFTFRGIRISISSASQDDQVTGMNLDLFGCLPANVTDSNTFDPCTTVSYSVPSTPLPDYYYRGYLYVSSFIFVCDEIASRSNSLDTFPRCFRANQTSGFFTWEDLGNQVGKVVGFDSANSIIYAIASDAKSYIMSEDNGVTWFGINGGGWQVLKNLGGLQSPTVLPWTSDTTFDSLTTGTSCTKYTAGTLYLCYDGIYSGTTRIFSWNSCCNL